MLARVLRRLRDRIRTKAYVMTLHADEEMHADGLSIFDVESVILTGEIVERQRQWETREWKYLVRGKTSEEDEAAVVCKESVVGRIVIITVYRC